MRYRLDRLVKELGDRKLRELTRKDVVGALERIAAGQIDGRTAKQLAGEVLVQSKHPDHPAAGSRVRALHRARACSRTLPEAPTGRLWEMRLKGRAGIARAIYVTAVGQRVVIVRAFAKKTQKTPRSELELALMRATEVQ